MKTKEEITKEYELFDLTGEEEKEPEIFEQGIADDYK